jgi:hypothetical protein
VTEPFSTRGGGGGGRPATKCIKIIRSINSEVQDQEKKIRQEEELVKIERTKRGVEM